MSYESALKTRCLKAYKLRYGNYIKKNEQIALVGDPDIFICHYGIFVAIELKRPGGKPSKRQLVVLKQIEDSLGICGVADSVDKFMAIVALADEIAGDLRKRLTNIIQKNKLGSGRGK